MKLTLKTPAKINLGLHILGKRNDGYHELQTLLQMVSLFDELELETQSSGIRLECDQPGVPDDGSNLVCKAARLVQETFPGRCSGVRIRLNKTIPAGAGLGGGSGNAAGTLMGLNVLWDLGLTQGELAPLAARLGSDVPFFLTAPCGLGSGRGEHVVPVKTNCKFSVLLVFPRFSVSTAEVYRDLKIKLTKRENNISILAKFLSQSDIACLGNGLFNDLEPVVIKRFPVLQAIKDQMRARQAKGTLLSGSGSAVFGIFDDPDQAKHAYALMKKEDWDLFLTQSVSDFSEFLPEKILAYPGGG